MAVGRAIRQRVDVRRTDEADAGTPEGPSLEASPAEAVPELWHDLVNIVVLCLIFSLAAGSLCLGEDSSGHTWVVVVTSAYLVLDTVWIALQPAIVRTPGSIIAHHVVTLLVICGTVENAMHRVNASRALLVEINTVFLTLRRRLGRPVWCEAAFYATWGILRLVWFPLLGLAMLASTFGLDDQLRAFLPEYVWVDVRSPPPIKAYASILFGAVVALQYYWTLALMRSVCCRREGGAEALLGGPRAGTAGQPACGKGRRGAPPPTLAPLRGGLWLVGLFGR